MNQQSTQRALLKCQKINKRRLKDENKVLRLIERNLRDLQEESENMPGSLGSNVPPQFEVQGRTPTTQDFKCDFTQRSLPGQHGIPGLPLRSGLSIGSVSQSGDYCSKDYESSREKRSKIDVMLQYSGRSHQNAVNMAKAVTKVLDLLQQS